MVLRFFVGILGGSFVPCQVWSTGFFDKNVVGTANSLTAGWGNSGGGITYVSSLISFGIILIFIAEFALISFELGFKSWDFHRSWKILMNEVFDIHKHLRPADS